MKDAQGHGSNPRGGSAAHQSGVEKIGLLERAYGKVMEGRWAKQEQSYGVKPWSKASQEEAGRRLAALRAQKAKEAKTTGFNNKWRTMLF